jgi:uncharacterized protein YbbK (DUF523 family)
MIQRRLSRKATTPGLTKSNKKVLVSACLVGVCCRFDGSQQVRSDVLLKLKGEVTIPICPEQLGGLPTPRIRAEIAGGNGFDVLQGKAQVIDSEGNDVTQYFLKGAKEALKIVRLYKIERAYLKEKSPSCGTKKIVFRKKVKHGPGVTTALLMKEGVEVISVP